LNDGGVDALIDKEKPGRPPKLTNDQKEKIKYLILDQTPESHGYNSSTWTGSLVIDWVTKNYNVVYKKAQIYNILEGLGLTFQKGKGYYPEAKDRTEKVEALKKTRARKE
jgi:transposase